MPYKVSAMMSQTPAAKNTLCLQLYLKKVPLSLGESSRELFLLSAHTGYSESVGGIHDISKSCNLIGLRTFLQQGTGGV